MASEPVPPSISIERSVHQLVCTADGTPYQAWATKRLWVVEGDPYLKTDGSRITPLTTGEQYFKLLAQKISTAQISICMLGWQINWDVMLTPGKRLYDALLNALKANTALKIYILPWNHSMLGPNTGDEETKAALTYINQQLSGKPRAFVTAATEMPTASAGLDCFYSHHQKQVIIDNKFAFMGGIDVCWGRRDDATYPLNATGRQGEDAYNGCVPHLIDVTNAPGFVDAQALNEPDEAVDPGSGILYKNVVACDAQAAIANHGVQRPLQGTMIDIRTQPRMPWQDVHLMIEGPSVSDLASNFVLRWNSANSSNLRLPLPPPPTQYPKLGTCSIQMLRSASYKMVDAELKAALPADKARVHGKFGHNHIYHAYVRLIDQAEHFIYIENQFFVSAYGAEAYWAKARLGQGEIEKKIDKPDQSPEVSSVTSGTTEYVTHIAWGSPSAPPSNIIAKALGEKFKNMILDASNASPDGKASPFHVYIALPVHSEGLLNEPATMTQVHYTLQTLVYGTQSLVNRIRRAIKARQLLDMQDVGYERVFDDNNLEYTQIPVDWCWAYLTLLNLRSWEQIGGHYVTEQIYIHSKVMIVDDRFAIVGSANINDRSQLGNRDSELAVLVMDTDFSYEDIGCPDGPTVVRKFARDLRIQLWNKIFGNTGGIRAAGLQDAITRPAAQESWQKIHDLAENNSKLYNAAFTFIPANDRTIWPTIQFEKGKRSAGLMPFDKKFWANPTCDQSAAAALKEIKGYITLLPWTWTLGQNNNSDMNSALFVENELPPTDHAVASLSSSTPPTETET